MKLYNKFIYKNNKILYLHLNKSNKYNKNVLTIVE